MWTCEFHNFHSQDRYTFGTCTGGTTTLSRQNWQVTTSTAGSKNNREKRLKEHVRTQAHTPTPRDKYTTYSIDFQEMSSQYDTFDEEDDGWLPPFITDSFIYQVLTSMQTVIILLFVGIFVAYMGVFGKLFSVSVMHHQSDVASHTITHRDSFHISNHLKFKLTRIQMTNNSLLVGSVLHQCSKLVMGHPRRNNE